MGWMISDLFVGGGSSNEKTADISAARLYLSCYYFCFLRALLWISRVLFRTRLKSVAVRDNQLKLRAGAHGTCPILNTRLLSMRSL